MSLLTLFVNAFSHEVSAGTFRTLVLGLIYIYPDLYSG